MHPWQLITPDLVLQKPIWSLTPALLSEYKLRGLILDVDNTIIGDSETEVSPEVRQWIDTIRCDYNIWLISNNFSNRRIQGIAESLNLPYRSRAGKPSRRTVRQALEAMKMQPLEVGMVGDRLFTDVLVGNRLGMFTVLVQPIDNRKSSWLGERSRVLRNWEIWLARRSGVNI
jgi:HAD superfamily phosphatase (TIGR01668 family)